MVPYKESENSEKKNQRILKKFNFITWKKAILELHNPQNVNKKQAVAANMNAMTWFLVMAEMQEPIARKAPAITKLPA